MANVYVFTADGFEEIEGLTVVDLMRRAGAQVQMVSISDGLAVKGSHGIEIKADTFFDDVDFDQADLLVLPGGMPGTLHLGEHEGLTGLLQDFAAKGKRVAAIIICVVIAGTTTVMSVEALRDGLFELIEKVYTRFSEITFEPVRSTYSMPEVFEEYSITNIPEGFTLETEHVNESLFIKEQVFLNGEHTIRFGQRLAENANFAIDTEGIKTETIEYGDKEIFYFSNKGIQYALWTEGGYAFIIHSDLSMEQVLEMAASVKK